MTLIAASLLCAGCGNTNYSNTTAKLEPAIAAIEQYYQQHGEFPPDEPSLKLLDTKGNWKGNIMSYRATDKGYTLVTLAGGYKDYLAFERTHNQGWWEYGDDSGDDPRILHTRNMPPLSP